MGLWEVPGSIPAGDKKEEKKGKKLPIKKNHARLLYIYIYIYIYIYNINEAFICLQQFYIMFLL